MRLGLTLWLFVWFIQSMMFVRLSHDSCFSKLPSNPKGSGIFVRFNTVILFSILALWHFDSQIKKKKIKIKTEKKHYKLSHNPRVMQFLENKIG